MTEHATRVVVSYPSDLSEWGRIQVDTRWFKAYLRRTKGGVSVGDGWDEFVDVGCCGNAMDVPLRVEAVEGGAEMGPDTEIEYTTREACDLETGWAVQSTVTSSRSS